MPIQYDDADWPIARARMLGVLTPHEEREFVDFTMRPLQHKRPFVGFIDLLDAATPTVRYIRLQASEMKRHHAALEAYCLGVAFVAPSAMLRGAVRAVLHLQGLSCPTLVTGALDEAEQWATWRVAKNDER